MSNLLVSTVEPRLVDTSGDVVAAGDNVTTVLSAVPGKKR
jgi:hypothetical protein